MKPQARKTIKQWSEDDRPREKMLQKGVRNLSNAELLAILLTSGNKNESAVDLAKRILAEFDNNLTQMGKASIDDLMKFEGIGHAKAVTIKAALELGKRKQTEEILPNMPLTNSNSIFKLISPLIGDLPYEEFWIILLNRANIMIEKFPLSQGGIAGTVVDIRMILKQAITKYASGIVLCHNHPSGNCKPSDNDKAITRKIQQAANIFDMKLIDHLIIAGTKYYSFADDNKI